MLEGKLTKIEHAQHIADNDGRCKRNGIYCNDVDCALMAFYGFCLNSGGKLVWANSVLEEAEKNKDRGTCISIW